MWMDYRPARKPLDDRTIQQLRREFWKSKLPRPVELVESVEDIQLDIPKFPIRSCA